MNQSTHPTPPPAIRWCENHQGWEWRWVDPAGRIVWYPVSGAPHTHRPEDVPTVQALAAEGYGCPPQAVESYLDKPEAAFGLCAPFNGKEMAP